ncbi:hypothetical protein IE4872_PD01038 (plasmid) [Rhizobium gallicum]|uniref:Uncharacterized protein n=1 Tax=Rhizobium gallicum TaxID=56730 RepID=A0A1L5NUI4_9HYPH|nr:hypothetical protein IE4872_PD01038 [Rhizobium gallicum]
MRKLLFPCRGAKGREHRVRPGRNRTLLVRHDVTSVLRRRCARETRRVDSDQTRPSENAVRGLAVPKLVQDFESIPHFARHKDPRYGGQTDGGYPGDKRALSNPCSQSKSRSSSWILLLLAHRRPKQKSQVGPKPPHIPAIRKDRCGKATYVMSGIEHGKNILFISNSPQHFPSQPPQGL